MTVCRSSDVMRTIVDLPHMVGFASETVVAGRSAAVCVACLDTRPANGLPSRAPPRQRSAPRESYAVPPTPAPKGATPSCAWVASSTTCNNRPRIASTMGHRPVSIERIMTMSMTNDGDDDDEDDDHDDDGGGDDGDDGEDDDG